MSVDNLKVLFDNFSFTLLPGLGLADNEFQIIRLKFIERACLKSCDGSHWAYTGLQKQK